jgi:hypothetical protein
MAMLDCMLDWLISQQAEIIADTNNPVLRIHTTPGSIRCVS